MPRGAAHPGRSAAGHGCARQPRVPRRARRHTLWPRDRPWRCSQEAQYLTSGLGAPREFCQSRDMPRDREIAELARLIEGARQAVVFTGAGISTESGIPDFRSPGGIWTRMAPIDFSDFLASEEARRETWRRRFEADDMWRSALPNRGHRAVAELVHRGTAATVITQNIDGLHQASGIPPKRASKLPATPTLGTSPNC